MNNYFATTAVQHPRTKRFLTLRAIGKEQPWRFPGGKLNVVSGESAVNAASRELMEEVGIRSTVPLRFLGVQHVQADSDLWVGYGFYTDRWEGTPAIHEPAKHDRLEWFSEGDVERFSNPFEKSLVTLSKLTPIQVKILDAIRDYKNEDEVSNEQIAARLLIPYRTWNYQLDQARKLAGLRSRKAHRAELAGWWRQIRGGI